MKADKPPPARRGGNALLLRLIFVAAAFCFGIVVSQFYRTQDATTTVTSPASPSPPTLIARPPDVARDAVDRERLTVVLMSYPQSVRHHLLARIAAKALAWSFVRDVILVWNGPADALPANITALHAKQRALPRPFPTFTILPQKENRVDNRWRIGDHISTEAVLNMDDDVDLFEEGARCMFAVWRASPSALVAIDVRSHFRHGTLGGDQQSAAAPVTDGPFGPWGYAARDLAGSVKRYSIALPRALLTSRAFYTAFAAHYTTPAATAATGDSVPKIVTELLCDDIAFNFVAANTTVADSAQRGHVVYAKARYEPYAESHDRSAMVHKPGMKPMRQKCVNRLTALFGDVLTARRWHVLCEVDG